MLVIIVLLLKAFDIIRFSTCPDMTLDVARTSNTKNIQLIFLHMLFQYCFDLISVVYLLSYSVFHKCYFIQLEYSTRHVTKFFDIR